MKVASTAFEHEGKIPSKYTCDGDNISPPLFFSDIPKNAKSLVLIMEDPDVPMYIRPDGMWDHWVLFNIPPETTGIASGEQPGTPGITTSNKNKYGGPCPPDREHRYYFKLFALDIKLDLKEGAAKKQVLEAIKGHILAEATLMGKYKRK